MADKKRKLEDADFTPSKRTRLASDEQQSFLQASTPPTASFASPASSTTIPTNLLPTHSNWFKLDQVNEIEKRAFADFFTSKSATKTPELYKQFRDFMVQAYRAAPNTYLTVTDCRKVLIGDVVVIMRIHAFLEHWGIINYTAEARNKLNTTNPFILQSLNQPPILHDYAKEPATPNERLVLLGSKPKAPTAPLVQPTSDWTDEETLKLLDSIEKYKDNWDVIAQRVNKPKEQCITHFLQLPIEEQFLQTSVEIPQAVNDDGTPKLEQPLPFADTTNPVMSMVAFLASVVDPTVASAAAKAALDSMADEVKKTSEQNGTDPNTFDVSKLDVKTAAATALGAAVQRAKVLASKEERDVQRYVAFAIDQQLKKLEAKMQYFDQLEQLLQSEHEQIETARQQLLAEKAAKQ